MIKFNYITTLEQYCQAVEELEQYPALAADTETYCLPEWEGKGGSALDPHTGRISLVILKGRTSLPYVFDIVWLDHLGCDYEPFRKLLFSRDYLLLQNAKFDLKFFYGTFGWMPENIRDTLIYSKIIGNATGSKAANVMGHGYADLCREYLNVHIGGKGEEQVSTWYLDVDSRTLENEWWLRKLQYAANDVKYLFPLEDIMRPAIITPMLDSPLNQTGNTGPEWGLGMAKALELETQYVVVAAEIEYRGIAVCKDTLRHYQAAVSDKVDELATQLCVDLDIETPTQNWAGLPRVSPSTLKAMRSSSRLLELIQRALEMKKIDNTQKATLKRLVNIIDTLSEKSQAYEDKDGNLVGSSGLLNEILIDEEEHELFGELELFDNSTLQEKVPIIKRILDFKKYTKQEGMNLLKYINPKTGRIHYSLITIGAATGRSSASRPNLQQVTGRVTADVTMPLHRAWKSNAREILI